MHVYVHVVCMYSALYVLCAPEALKHYRATDWYANNSHYESLIINN